MSSKFQTVGACRFEAVLDLDQITRVTALFGTEDHPGKRLSHDNLRGIADLIGACGAIGRVSTELLGPDSKPVRALLLDKSDAANWRLGWHQDRTVAVRKRIEVPGFGPWSTKAGQLHVQPPHEFTARMITLRVHVDPVGPDNAPLEVLPGSHSLGRLTSDAVDELASMSDRLVCLANAGDVWAYATAIVHASAEQRRPGRRRVLHIDYSADQLPGGLEWVALV